jgi:tetratricopeptide (TPR) repeat protein
MPVNPSKLSQFWQELKRRKVIKVIAMYAATAFIIMEAADIMLPRLGLPDWTVTFLIILLIVGFPITIILSWIFDFTPEGVKKTEPIEEVKEQELPLPLVKRRLKTSDVIIAVLFVAVVILLYPKIFTKDKFEDIRDEDGRISIVVMPFQNVTGDTLFDGMELGLQNLLITSLSNSNEIAVRQTQTIYEILGSTRHLNYASITPSIASDIALKLEANTVILGSLYKSGNNLRITVNLLESRSEEIYKSFEIDGDSDDDFFTITDSLTSLIRNHLEIKVLEEHIGKEIRSFGISGTAEAYRYLSKGLNKFWQTDYEAALNYFETAQEIDPNIFAVSWHLIAAYNNMGKYIQARKLIDDLYKEIDHYTYLEQLLVKFWKSNYDKNPQESIRYVKLIVEENPLFRGMWYQLGWEYYEIKQYEDALFAFEKALEIDQSWGGGWEWLAIYWYGGMANHKTGQHTREKEIYALGLSVLPDQQIIIYEQAICALSQGDTIEANEYIAKLRSLGVPEIYREHDINHFIGSIYEEAGYVDIAEKILRQTYDANPQDNELIYDLAYLLIDHDINVNEGLKLINRALEIEPDNPYYLDTKGWGLHKQGKDSVALELLNKAWDLSLFYEHDIFLHIKEVEQALASQNK